MTQVAYVREPDLNYEAVVLQDAASGDAIEVQRALSFDEQDAAAGQATYCLCRDGAAAYGGVRRWSVEHDALTLWLSDEAADALDLPPVTKIALTGDHHELLAAHLPRLLDTRP